MDFLSFITATLLLARTVCCSDPSESARDQYKSERQDESRLLMLPNAATNYSPQVESLHISARFMHRASDSSQTERHAAPGLLTVAGSKFPLDKHLKKYIDELEMAKSSKDNHRKIFKRSYAPWDTSNLIQPSYQSISVWKPPLYQLSRPYYVPIFGVSGRVPIYYSPQPLYHNAGSPQDNPAVQKPPFVGPTYLPPTTKSPTKTNTMKVDDRFNNEDDEKPVWDTEDAAAPPNVPNAKPTRRPARPTTQPPLVRPTGATQNPQANKESLAPPASANGTTPPSGPSRCVWAIISCCSATSEIRYNCFEQLGCTGAFWDASPCDSAYAEAAIEAALKYYDN